MTEQDHKAAAVDDIVFLGRAVERLSVLIADQSKIVFDQKGITIPVRSCSLMTVLADLQNATASDLARELGQSHQLVMQKIPKLLRLDLIASRPDEDDARKKIFHVTTEGEHQLEKFAQCCEALRTAYQALFGEVGDVRDMVVRTVDALNERPLDQRIEPGG